MRVYGSRVWTPGVLCPGPPVCTVAASLTAKLPRLQQDTNTQIPCLVAGHGRAQTGRRGACTGAGRPEGLPRDRARGVNPSRGFGPFRSIPAESSGGCPDNVQRERAGREAIGSEMAAKDCDHETV